VRYKKCSYFDIRHISYSITLVCGSLKARIASDNESFAGRKSTYRFLWKGIISLIIQLGEFMKLLIRNLTRTTTEAELKAMFENYGDVQSCTLVMDKATGGSKGFGFVEMPKAGDAKAAIKNLNGKDVAGNKIRVKKAEPAPGQAGN
jgi:RNA recognition motif-containing protein